MSTEQRLHGVCARWFSAKGYGFIKDRDSEAEYFCHHAC
eukprot:gene23224-9540_t